MAAGARPSSRFNVSNSETFGILQWRVALQHGSGVNAAILHVRTAALNPFYERRYSNQV